MRQFESFVLDTSNECLWHKSVPVVLANKLFSVLRYLVENPGRLITHDELLDALWPETYVQPQVLRTYVLELRKILGDDAKQPTFIQTLPKRGYKFVATVTENANPAFGAAGASAISTADECATDLVGRDEEVLRLQNLVTLAAGGQRQFVFITGGAGIGKTAVIKALSNVTSPEVSMVCGHCAEGLSEREDYYPIFEAFGQFLSSDHERGLAAGPAWQRDFHDRPGELCEALERSAQEKICILVIEDIQWAHESTLKLLSALARRGTAAKLMVIATYRPQDRSTSLFLKSMKQDLLVRHLCSELALTPLSNSALKQLLSRRLKQSELPIGLDHFVFQRSAGNPLLALALLEHMIVEHVLVRSCEASGGAWEQVIDSSEIEISVPCELAKLIELEIDRLNAQEQKILEAGSLMKIVFPVWAVAAALDEAPEDIEELCDDLERRTGLIHRAGHDDLPDGTRSDFYSFTHEFYREALYQRQTTGRRAKGHIRIAERLRTLFAGREANVAREMAMQYEAAGHWQRAAAELRAAARHACERRAFQESHQLLEHASRIAENMSDTERGVSLQAIGDELEMVRAMIAGAWTATESQLKI